MKINLRILAALSVAAASKEESRYYLRGVFIQPDRQGRIIATALDGNMLIAWHVPTHEGADSDWPAAGVIVPSDLLSRVRRGKRDSDWANITVGPENMVTIAHETAGTYQMAAVDGTFPDWRRVMPPSDYDTREAYFAAKYVTALEKFRRDTGLARAFIVPNATGPAIIDFDNTDFTGAIMPVKGNASTAKPSWA